MTGRLIEVQRAQDLPPTLTITAGDVLIFGATGGHIHSGAEVVEILGPFVRGVVGDNGQVISPMGAPNRVLFLALHPGRATIDVVTGDPWHTPKTTALSIIVEP
jgi:hypothetical protein